MLYIFPLTHCWVCQTQAWMDFHLILYGHSHVLMNCSFSRNYFIPLQTDSMAAFLLHGQVNKPDTYNFFSPESPSVHKADIYTWNDGVVGQTVQEPSPSIEQHEVYKTLAIFQRFYTSSIKHFSSKDWHWLSGVQLGISISERFQTPALITWGKDIKFFFL